MYWNKISKLFKLG